MAAMPVGGIVSADVERATTASSSRRDRLSSVSDRRATRYERHSQAPLMVLAVLFLATYAWPILDPGLPSAARSVCTWAGFAIWVLFVVDYLVRLALAERRLAFVRRNWFDLPLLALPMLRPLRLLRGLVALRFFSRGGASFARGRVVVSTAAAVAAGGTVAALALLEAERSNPDANVRNYGDALWWAMSTITTVGYGDRYPTTAEGRLVAAALMVAGITLLGVVTASLASWFVERIGEVTRAERGMEARLDALVSEIAALRRQIDQRQPNDPHG